MLLLRQYHPRSRIRESRLAIRRACGGDQRDNNWKCLEFISFSFFFRFIRIDTRVPQALGHELDIVAF